jgi:hypothetical protein
MVVKTRKYIYKNGNGSRIGRKTRKGGANLREFAINRREQIANRNAERKEKREQAKKYKEAQDSKEATEAEKNLKDYLKRLKKYVDDEVYFREFRHDNEDESKKMALDSEIELLEKQEKQSKDMSEQEKEKLEILKKVKTRKDEVEKVKEDIRSIINDNMSPSGDIILLESEEKNKDKKSTYVNKEKRIQKKIKSQKLIAKRTNSIRNLKRSIRKKRRFDDKIKRIEGDIQKKEESDAEKSANNKKRDKEWCRYDAPTTVYWDIEKEKPYVETESGFFDKFNPFKKMFKKEIAQQELPLLCKSNPVKKKQRNCGKEQGKKGKE